ncbi:hypothetical protein MKR37_12455 [Staphylococcus haemolyticus]|nr:hypothetical protein [Staphylococcus haemolyticus]
MSRSKVSFLAPMVADLRSARVGRCHANRMVADLRSARVGRCHANRMDAMSRYRDRKVSFFMPKIKTEGLIRYQQINV